MTRSVGIVGGGLLGLAVAYRLAVAGVRVDVVERADELGGLVGSFDFDGYPVDRFYHVILPTDHRVLGLAEELGLGDRVRFRPTGVGFWHEGRFLSVDSIGEFLRFGLLTPMQRLRLGAFVFGCQRRSGYADLEDTPLLPWLERRCGKGVVDRLWRPLLHSKFDGRADDLPATYMWARTRRMAGTRDRAGHEIMGTIEGGYATLVEALRQAIEAHGGSIRTGITVHGIYPDARGATIETDDDRRSHDLVLSTLLPPQAQRLLRGSFADAAPTDRCRYLGVACLVARTSRSMSPYYTLNLPDRTVDLTTIVETTHVVDPQTVRGHLLYITKYASPSSSLFTDPEHEVSARLLQAAKRILPSLDDALVSLSLQRARAVEPVHTVGAAGRTPDMFPAPGLALASSAHVYPEVVNGQAVLGVAERVVAGIEARLAHRNGAAAPVGSAT